MSLMRITLSLWLAGCAAQPNVPEAAGPSQRVRPQRFSGIASSRPQPATAAPVEQPSPLRRALALLDRGDYRRADPLLREELAAGPGFREAALALAAFYRSREDHAEAEAILRSALSRDPNSLELELMQARVCAETNRWQDAAEILRRLAPAHPESASLKMALVAAERALGNFDAASSLLDQVLQGPITDPLINASLEAIQILAEDLAEERRQGRRLSRTANELFAELRAGAKPAVRREAFKALASRAGTRLRAVLIAYQQRDPLLRVMAVRAWPVDQEDPEELIGNVRLMFSDPDPRVRAAVSGLASRLDRDRAVELLLAAMANEQDGYAFRSMHADLGMILGAGPRLSPGAEDDPEARARMVENWRKVWHR